MQIQRNIFNTKFLNYYLKDYSIDKIDDYSEKWQVIKNIASSLKKNPIRKEKSIKDLYLFQLFTNVLGYSSELGNSEGWNLDLETKTDIDNSRADGALGFFNGLFHKDVRVVIEMKPPGTNLDKGLNNEKRTPVEQAFEYKSKMNNCRWVIVSDFNEIRLYYSTFMIYEKFLLQDLAENEEEFKRFYFLLNKDHLIRQKGASKIEILLEENKIRQECILNKFYCEYLYCLEQIYYVFRENNLTVDAKELFNWTQQILNNFILNCFVEDNNILRLLKSLKGRYSPSDEQHKKIFKLNNKNNLPLNKKQIELVCSKINYILDQLNFEEKIFVLLEKIAMNDFQYNLTKEILSLIFNRIDSTWDRVMKKAEINESKWLENYFNKRNIYEINSLANSHFIISNPPSSFQDNDDQNLVENDKKIDPSCGSNHFIIGLHAYLEMV